MDLEAGLMLLISEYPVPYTKQSFEWRDDLPRFRLLPSDTNTPPMTFYLLVLFPAHISFLSCRLLDLLASMQSLLLFFWAFDDQWIRPKVCSSVSMFWFLVFCIAVLWHLESNCRSLLSDYPASTQACICLLLMWESPWFGLLDLEELVYLFWMLCISTHNQLQ